MTMPSCIDLTFSKMWWTHACWCRHVCSIVAWVSVIVNFSSTSELAKFHIASLSGWSSKRKSQQDTSKTSMLEQIHHWLFVLLLFSPFYIIFSVLLISISQCYRCFQLHFQLQQLTQPTANLSEQFTTFIGTVTVYLHQFRSLSNKLNQFQSFVYSSSFHVLSLTETWLKFRQRNTSNYTIYQSDQTGKNQPAAVVLNSSFGYLLFQW